MTIKIVDRDVKPIIATYWYLEKMIQEVPLVEPRAKSIGKFSFPDDFIKRQTTDIIDKCIRGVQALYSWEKNSFTGIVYREECFNDEVNNVLKNGNPLTSIKKTVGQNSTVEHVITVSHFKDKFFNLYKQGNLEQSKIEIVKSFLSPVALINKHHTNKDNENNVNKGFQIEEKYPFKRYINSGIKIITHDGQIVDNNTWTLEDHWKLLRRTEYFKDIMENFNL